MSAPYAGLNTWVLQRFSAIFLLFYIIYLLAVLLLAPPTSHAELKQWVASPWVSVSLTVFFTLLVVHIWVGLRDVVLDYLANAALRISVLAVIALLLLGSLFWFFRLMIKALV